MHVFGWGLAAVRSIASDASHIWIITQCGIDGGEGDAIVELSASTGSYVQTLTDVPKPSGLLSNGTYLWVIEKSSDEIFEISVVTGAIENTFTSQSLGAPIALALAGPNIWVLNANGGLDELRAATLAPLREISIPPLDNPTAFTYAHGAIWVTEDGSEGDSTHPNRLVHVGVAEYNEVNGKQIRFLQGASYGFHFPSSIAPDGGSLWITDANRTQNDQVTEISVRTGALVHVLNRGYGFYGDDQVTSDGPYVLVHNAYDDTITVMRASNARFVHRVGLPDGPQRNAGPDGHWMAVSDGRVWAYSGFDDAPGLRHVSIPSGKIEGVVQGSQFGFNYPRHIGSDGTHLWVASTHAVTEMSALDGSLIRVLRGPSYGFWIESLSSDSQHVWTLNYPDSITELSASSGALVQVIKGAQYNLSGASSISTDGTDVWIANPTQNSVTEIDAASGALVQVLSAVDDQFASPGAISSDGVHVWISNGGSKGVPPHVSELNASNGSFVRTIHVSGDQIDSDGTDVWLTEEQAGSPIYFGTGVIELTASTGAQVTSFNASANVPVAVASDGSAVWIANCACDVDFNAYGSVAELSPTSGSEVSLGTIPPDAVNGPSSIAIAGGRAWVTNTYGDSVTSFPSN